MGTTLVRRSLLATLLAAGAATGLAAQAKSAPPRILVALAGCWSPAGVGVVAPSTCVVPGEDGLSLRMVAVGNPSSVTETVLRLDGERTPFEASGCSGWQEARASSDGERVLISSEVKCGASPLQKRSAVLLITPTGYWLRAEAAGVASLQNAQVELLESATSLLGVPADVRDAVTPVAAEAEALRAAIGRSYVTSADLVDLEKMGAADPIIDVVVAAANPKSFQLSVAGPMLVASAPADDEERSPEPRPSGFGRYGFGFGYPFMSEAEFAYLNGCSSLAYGLYDPRFCSLYSYGGYSYWSRYSGYGYGSYYPGYGYYPPGTVVVITPTKRTESGGHVSRGQGYQNTGTPTAGRSGTPRAVSSQPASSSRSPSGTSSGSASSGSSGSTGSSSGSGTRTAHPRSP